MIERLVIIGVGLIGGSLARALREAGAVGEVVGCGRDRDHLEEAVRLGVIDRYELDADDAVEGADVVVLAVPVGSTIDVLEIIGPSLGPETVLTDVGSVKGSVVTDAHMVFGQMPPSFIPGHPIAGTERSGVAASSADLFRGRRVILTPETTSDPRALATVRAMWEQCGAEVVEMEVAHHDQVLAATSHLPHMLAFGLVDALARGDDPDAVFRYAAGGFRDFTRIASSDPLMWRDICLANRDALLAALEAYRDDLEDLTAEVRAGDGDGLLARFRRAKTARDRFCG